MSNISHLIAALSVLAICITAAVLARRWALRSEAAATQAVSAAQRSETAAGTAVQAAANSIDALRRKAAALRCYADVVNASDEYQWGVRAIADDLDRAARRLDPEGPGMSPVSGGVFAKDADL